MAIFGMMPLGSVIVGAVSERLGAPETVLAEGVLPFAKYLTRKTITNSVTNTEAEKMKNIVEEGRAKFDNKKAS